MGEDFEAYAVLINLRLCSPILSLLNWLNYNSHNLYQINTFLLYRIAVQGIQRAPDWERLHLGRDEIQTQNCSICFMTKSFNNYAITTLSLSVLAEGGFEALWDKLHSGNSLEAFHQIMIFESKASEWSQEWCLFAEWHKATSLGRPYHEYWGQ